MQKILQIIINNNLLKLNNDKNISTYIDFGNIINNLNCILKKSSSDKPANSTDSIPDFNDQILSFIKKTLNKKATKFITFFYL